jgi:transketolase
VCLGAAELLKADGISARVVSMPCWDLFEVQDDEYQADVLLPDVPILAVEAASSFGWDRWADDSVSIDRFGASAPGDVVLEKLGFTAENVARRAIELIEELEDE